ncbi:MAG: zinc ribbon domain-containing protein [Pseudonocardiaceae bacterium]
MTYCTNCGTAQQPDTRFCPGCGKGKQVSAPAVHRRTRGRLVAIVTMLVLLLGAGGVAAWATLVDTPDALPDPAPPPSPPQPETSTSRAVDPTPSSDTPSVNPEDAARDGLTRQISLDRPQVQSELAEAWVPQLSSKRPGLVVDGIPYAYSDILNDHLSLRPTYDARLVWSGDWSSFREGDFYVTVAAEPFSTSAEANAWCDTQNLDAANCFAKRLSTTAGPDGSIVSR